MDRKTRNFIRGMGVNYGKVVVEETGFTLGGPFTAGVRFTAAIGVCAEDETEGVLFH